MRSVKFISRRKLFILLVIEGALSLKLTRDSLRQYIRLSSLFSRYGYPLSLRQRSDQPLKPTDGGGNAQSHPKLYWGFLSSALLPCHPLRSSTPGPPNKPSIDFNLISSTLPASLITLLISNLNLRKVFSVEPIYSPFSHISNHKIIDVKYE